MLVIGAGFTPRLELLVDNPEFTLGGGALRGSVLSLGGAGGGTDAGGHCEMLPLVVLLLVVGLLLVLLMLVVGLGGGE